jgi:hypothetical protein
LSCWLECGLRLWWLDLLGRFRLASLGETGEAPVAKWPRQMALPHGLGAGLTGERDSDLFRELQVVGSEQSFVPLRRHRDRADARDFCFDLCIDEPQQRIDLIRIEHRCVRSPMIAAFCSARTCRSRVYSSLWLQPTFRHKRAQVTKVTASLFMPAYWVLNPACELPGNYFKNSRRMEGSGREGGEVGASLRIA